MNLYVTLIITAFCIPFILCAHQNTALVCVPVADLIGQPMRTFYGPSCHVKTMYETLPECGQGTLATSFKSCPRLHQALLHDEVEIVEYKGPEVRIKVHAATDGQ